MFQRIVNDVLRDHLRIFPLPYINNIPTFSKNDEEQQQHYELVHGLLQQHQLFPCID